MCEECLRNLAFAESQITWKIKGGKGLLKTNGQTISGSQIWWKIPRILVAFSQAL